MSEYYKETQSHGNKFDCFDKKEQKPKPKNGLANSKNI